MTTLLDHPDTGPDTGHGTGLAAGHPVLSGVVEVHQLLDRMNHGAAVPLAAGGHARLVAELDRAARRIEALKLKVVAAADRAGAAAAAGFTGTDAWVARQTTTPRAVAARQVALATGLESGHEPTATALDAGLLSPAHAAVILRAARDLPTGVTSEQRAVVEAALVEQARRFDPDQLRRVARRAIETIEPDPQVVDAHENQLIRTEEEAAREKTSLTLHDNGDGTVTGRFTLPTLAAAILGKVIDTVTAPRRMRHRQDNGSGEGLGRGWDWAHRRGLAFTEILEHLPTDHLHPKNTATLVVTLDHDTLAGALKTAHIDTGGTISAGEARRLACGAGLIPAVLDGPSTTLDLGRGSRLFSPAQRIAVGLRHDTCAADGCQRPYAWCELHHVIPWHHGGTTDLDNALPLCHQHHQWIHDDSYAHHRQPDGTIRFSRQT